MGVVGIVVLLGIAFLLSNDRRRALNPRIIGWGFALQLAMALFALRTRAGARLFSWANDLANDFIGFADAGIRFVFGDWPASRSSRRRGPTAASVGGSASCWRSRCSPSSSSWPA